MKKIFFIVVFVLAGVLTSMSQTDTSAVDSIVTEKPEIVFDTLIHNFGTIQYGGNGTYKFKFTNNGNVPLVLSSVKATCGCTTPNWSKDPVLPGNSGIVTVVYDTKRPGMFEKGITVYSNARTDAVRLLIKGEVLSQQNKPILGQ